MNHLLRGLLIGSLTTAIASSYFFRERIENLQNVALLQQQMLKTTSATCLMWYELVKPKKPRSQKVFKTAPKQGEV